MKFKKACNNLKKIKKETLIKIIVFLVLVVKTISFMAIGSSLTGRTFIGWGVQVDTELLLAHVAFILILFIPSFFFKGKRQLTYLIVIDTLYSILLLADLWYYRASRNYLGLRHIFLREMFN